MADSTAMIAEVSYVFAGAEAQKVSLLSLPRFSETGMLVLFNLSTLEAHTISFDMGQV